MPIAQAELSAIREEEKKGKGKKEEKKWRTIISLHLFMVSLELCHKSCVRILT